MLSVQPSNLTDNELIRYADMLLNEGKLDKEWQEEILKRLERLTYSEPRSDWR